MSTTDFRYDVESCLITPTWMPEKDPEFAAWLKRERQVAGLTQKQLAKKSGVGERTIQRWEQDEATPRRFERKKVEEALGHVTSTRHSKTKHVKPVTPKLDSSASEKHETDERSALQGNKINKKVSSTVSSKTPKKTKDKKYDCSTCPLNKALVGQTPFSQFVDGYGKCENGIFVLAEAPGETETQTKIDKPFVGSAGNELNLLLDLANVERDYCRT